MTCNAFWNGATVNFYRSTAPRLPEHGRDRGHLRPRVGPRDGQQRRQPQHRPPPARPSPTSTPSCASTPPASAAASSQTATCGGYGDACTARRRRAARASATSTSPTTAATSPTRSPGSSAASPAHSAADRSAAACPTGGGGALRPRDALRGHGRGGGGLGPPVPRPARPRPSTSTPTPPSSSPPGSSSSAARPSTTGTRARSAAAAAPPAATCNFLAADDDDGNLANGTPHMTAIRAAFERHEIHCATPAGRQQRLRGRPDDAPTVHAGRPGPGRRAELDGGGRRGPLLRLPRPRASTGCDFGKVKIGETTGSRSSTADLANGRAYYYAVLPVGANGACFGPHERVRHGHAGGRRQLRLPPADTSARGRRRRRLPRQLRDGHGLLHGREHRQRPTLTNVAILERHRGDPPPDRVPDDASRRPSRRRWRPAQTANGTFEFVPQGLVFDRRRGLPASRHRRRARLGHPHQAHPALAHRERPRRR